MIKIFNYFWLPFIVLVYLPNINGDGALPACHIFESEINEVFKVTSDFVFSENDDSIPIEEDVTFYSLIPGNPEFQIVNQENFGDIIKLDLPIIYLIHGWMESLEGNVFVPSNVWLKDAAKALHQYTNVNVICVDYRRLAKADYVTAATVNYIKVGSYVAQFIGNVSAQHNLALANLTIVGHSLGGQVMGITGAALGGNVGYMIGLDVAGPCFTNPTDAGIDNRLDATDAVFVQVIHTNCGGLGTQINCGHADFYSNGGAIQCGCVSQLSINASTLTCSHGRSHRIFISSINPANVFNGKKCLLIPASCNAIESVGSLMPVVETLLQPILKCTGAGDVFGLYAARKPGIFTMQTNGNPPYTGTTCEYPWYKILFG